MSAYGDAETPVDEVNAVVPGRSGVASTVEDLSAGSLAVAVAVGCRYAGCGSGVWVAGVGG